ncbi:3-oxoacyl-[acyl-carrier-protein] synthase II [Pilibacter termitis]|uniref:3-oxoacyl-[acyl-carrier-protein] synthase 2 n=1 Tax=Pilibacter termitis TaxID=263852 RepID=A0A1T4KZQ4_9ENTE|nr:beta-ketoacyl-ACP synthase II [Pilibacter termitis]SJZ47818.1 3-oxoacyl-[acyl-carrier-protein] synthase II [Pilibacter termitis]
MNRVVITGYGVTSPIGNTAEEFWESLEKGTVGIDTISRFDATESGISVAGEIKDFPFDKYFVKKDAKRMDMFSIYGIYAALEAVAMSGLDLENEDMNRFGVIVGSGIGGLPTIQEQITRMNNKGMKRVAPLFIPMAIANMAAGNIALRLGAKGICTSVVTACASATNSIGEAFRSIKHGYSDVIVAGGAEASICEIGIAGFASLTALSATEDPKRASIPFDKDRNGFVMGEGAGILVLESLEHAQKRGAKILGEVVGYGANCDAYHMTSPEPNGSGAAKAMQLALDEAGISPSEVGYINAHGTSTQANEKGESKAIETVFGDDSNVLVSSTKSLTGHLLGAAGGIEAIATLEALQHQFVPVNAGTTELGEDIHVNVVLEHGVEHTFDYAISNSLGFGGHNAVICLKKWSE